MYFEKFPQIVYSLDNGTTNFVITDIFRRVIAKTESLTTATAYDDYDIQDGDTPEIVSDKVYNTVDLYWTILIANQILDPRWDWPVASNALSQYITDKYGVGNENGIHHYVNTDGDIVHSSYAGVKSSVTNTMYEDGLNEAKRRISLIKPQHLQQFLSSFSGLLNNGNN
jgi:hypothetical protein